MAFGALGAPLIGLQGVTGLDLKQLSAMVGRQLPFFSLMVPFWLILSAAASGDGDGVPERTKFHPCAVGIMKIDGIRGSISKLLPTHYLRATAAACAESF